MSNDEWILPDKDTEYFAYVKVADIPYPEHPTDTKKGWHRTDTTPKQMERLMKRFKPLLQIIRDRDGDAKPDDSYWVAFWCKHDEDKRLPFERSTVQLYKTFFGWQMCRVIKYPDNQYEAESGLHRIWFAKKMGFEVLPVWVLVTKYKRKDV